MEPLAAAGMESYQRAYKLLVRLQQLKELEQVEGLLFDAHGRRWPCERDGVVVQCPCNYVAWWCNHVTWWCNVVV